MSLPAHLRFILRVIVFDADLRAGLRSWRIWITWGWIDIRQRYRRSAIGPFWNTISLGVTIAGLSLVFGALFGQPLKSYLPFVCTGMILWSFLVGVANDSAQLFTTSATTIKSVPLPISVYVFRMIVRQYVILLHHIPIYLVIAILFDVQFTYDTLWLLLGLALLTLNCIWVGLLLGILGARFRDVPQIVQNFMQFVFFVTPVFWRAESLGRGEKVIQLNVFGHLIEIVRQPLLGNAPSALNWAVACGLAAVGFLVAVPMFVRYRRRMAHWL